MNNLPQRKQIRFIHHNYSQGKYFITICTKNRIPFFGKFSSDKLILSDIGRIAQQNWREIPKNFPNTILDEFIIMPDHIHGIIILEKDSTGMINHAPTLSPIPNNPMTLPYTSLGHIIRSYKAKTTYIIRKFFGHSNFAWQRIFYEHIILSELALNNIRTYICNNPKHHLDKKDRKH